jgi:hypothetical protein
VIERIPRALTRRILFVRVGMIIIWGISPDPQDHAIVAGGL